MQDWIKNIYEGLDKEHLDRIASNFDLKTRKNFKVQKYSGKTSDKAGFLS